ncbi:hypothetical protein Vretifemale_4460 [Volvox reticuliferus]|uniref:Uncharacterized protein n=1 Tax=Volvox reticuliferus TaxID=1737510 RepID=A0A8J4FGY4_9CHLO|nr:hypothetical protein Vretifemale_4460 [Volvox reticuliferus]
MALKDFFKDIARWFSSPLSGTKRRRDESNLNDHHEARKAPTVRAGQTSIAGMDELKPSQRNGEPPAAGPAPPSLQDPMASKWQLATENSQQFTFDVADRVRELAPTRGAKAPQASAGRFLQQAQTVRQFDSMKSDSPPAFLSGQRLGTGGVHPPPRPFPPVQELHQQRQQQPPEARAAVPSSDQFERYVTPGGATTNNVGISGYHGTTSRQLFATPDSTRRNFDNLRLGGNTPAARGGVAGASTGADRLDGASIGGGNSYHGAPAGGSTATATACAAGPSYHGPMGHKMPLSRMTPKRGQSGAPYQYHQQLPPQPMVPFHVSFMAHIRDLGGVAKTQEELKAMVQAFEARTFRRERAIPLREDGGYIPGDDEDEETAKTSALTQDVRATVERLRTTLAATVRKVANDPRVTAAAGSRKAAQTALEASQAAAGANTLAAIGLKMAAQEQALKQIHTQMEEETRRKLEALRAEQAVRREQQQQHHQRIREGFMLLQQQISGTAGPSATAGSVPVAQAASAAAAPALAAARHAPGPAAGRGRAPAGTLKPPQPPDDDVVDLLSSDDEEEGEEEEEEDEVAEEDGQEDEDEFDNGDPYGVEYGAYPGEHRGRGNPALAVATRAERSTWRRTMDSNADPGEVMVDFRPNTVLVIELPRAKLQCMDLGVWLNDEVINLYDAAAGA